MNAEAQRELETFTRASEALEVLTGRIGEISQMMDRLTNYVPRFQAEAIAAEMVPKDGSKTIVQAVRRFNAALFECQARAEVFRVTFARRHLAIIGARDESK